MYKLVFIGFYTLGMFGQDKYNNFIEVATFAAVMTFLPMAEETIKELKSKK